MDNDLRRFRADAELLKVLAHPIRLCIARGLWRHGGCNVTHMQDCLQVPQSTISQHLGKLRAAGIIRGTRNGVEVRYELANSRVADLLQVLFSGEKK